MTGARRLTATVGPRTRRIVYGVPGPAGIRGELGPISAVDLAHVVMPAERGTRGTADGRRLAEMAVHLAAELLPSAAAVPDGPDVPAVTTRSAALDQLEALVDAASADELLDLIDQTFK
jgi:hypothetical protein